MTKMKTWEDVSMMLEVVPMSVLDKIADDQAFYRVEDKDEFIATVEEVYEPEDIFSLVKVFLKG